MWPNMTLCDWQLHHPPPGEQSGPLDLTLSAWGSVLKLFRLSWKHYDGVMMENHQVWATCACSVVLISIILIQHVPPVLFQPKFPLTVKVINITSSVSAASLACLASQSWGQVLDVTTVSNPLLLVNREFFMLNYCSINNLTLLSEQAEHAVSHRQSMFACIDYSIKPPLLLERKLIFLHSIFCLELLICHFLLQLLVPKKGKNHSNVEGAGTLH